MNTDVLDKPIVLSFNRAWQVRSDKGPLLNYTLVENGSAPPTGGQGKRCALQR